MFKVRQPLVIKSWRAVNEYVHQFPVRYRVHGIVIPVYGDKHQLYGFESREFGF